MELYCYDSDINLIDVIEKFSSLEWLEEYNGLGAFKLIADYTERNVEDLKQNNILWKNNGETAGIIEYVKYKDNIIECRGRLTNKLLEDRIILNTITINNIEEGLRLAVSANCIVRNEIPNLILGQLNNIADIGKKMITHSTVFEAVNSYRSVGLKVIFNIEAKKHEVEFYKGIDRSLDVLFSEEFENIFENEITSDATKYKNIAYVYGEGEGEAGEYTVVDLSGGSYQNELYVDARDIQKELLTDEGYTALLQERGIEKLANQIQENTFKCNIKTDGVFKYKEDFFLGDFVTCRSDKYKIQFKVRVAQVKEIYNNKGYRISAILGEQNKEVYYG